VAVHSFEIMADYHQVLLMDDRSATVVLPQVVTDADVKRRLTLAPGAVIIHTARNMPVPITIDISDAPPLLRADAARWDHITECSISISSGRMVVAGLTDYLPDSPRVRLPPGAYRLRAHHAGLGSLSADGLAGNDHYAIVMWPAPLGEPEVLKQYPQGS
jgi:hypothetical protein